MKKILILCALALSISSCGIIRVHKMNIEQGNIFTPEMTQKLHKGMSEESVRDIMGTPVLINTFDNNRVDYVYTYKPGYGELKEKYMTLQFSNGILRDIKGNMYSQVMR